MNIQPVVEGGGEVAAFPVLLRRLIDAAEAWEVGIGKPVLKPRGQLVRRKTLGNAVRLAIKQPECRSVLILIDGDDDCPAELGPRMKAWAANEAGGRPCEVVIAQREYEAWFLAGLEALRGRSGITADAPLHPRPEEPRDAKRQLKIRMGTQGAYFPTAHQAALSARFSLPCGWRRSGSFRKLSRSFGALVRGMGKDLAVWPPRGWADEVRR